MAALLGILGCRRSGQTDHPHPAVGNEFSAIEILPLRSEDEITADNRPEFVSELPEGVVLVHLWGTWCGPCRMEYPELAEMVERWESEPSFHFISISNENSADATYQSLTDETKEFLASQGIHHTVYCDPRGQTRETVAKSLGNANLYFPTTLLIDRNQKIAAVWEGYDPAGVSQMNQQISDLLAAK